MYNVNLSESDYSKKVKEILFDNRIKLSELAEKCNVSPSQITNILSKEKNDMFLSTAMKLCNATGKSLDVIFGNGGFVKEEVLKIIDEEIGDLSKEDISGKTLLKRLKKVIEKIN